MKKTKKTGNEHIWVPRSDAENAYELLQDVENVILAEPRRIHMNYWQLKADNPVRAFSSNRQLLRRDFPACGMVGCVGGWTEAIGRRGPNDRRQAQELLGLSLYQTTGLFYKTELLHDAETHGQTRAHARRVVKHIRAFRAANKQQLLATKV